MAAAPEHRELDPELLGCREFVSDAYGRWHPERMDLFHDMSAQEGFIVDGEAIVIEAFSNWNVDWKEGCGQLLHATYVAEKILDEFTCRGGIFAVAFFDCNRNIWASDPSKLLARDLIVRHLRATLPKIVHQFSSWWGDAAWERFIAVQMPSFILLNDGEQVEQICFPAEGADADAVADVQFLLHSFMVDCIIKRVHAVYTTRLVPKDNFIHGFVVRSSSKRFLPMGKEINSAGIEAECEALFGKGGKNALTIVAEASYPSAPSGVPAGAPGLEGDALRVRLLAPAVAAVLKGAQSFAAEGGADLKAGLAQAFLLHLLVLTRLPLSYRSQSLMEETQEVEEQSPYFAQCDAFFAAVMKHAAKEATSTAEDLRTPEGQARETADAQSGEFSDAWDHRMFRKVIGVLLLENGALAGPASLVADFTRVWTAVSGSAPDTAAILTCKDAFPPPPASQKVSSFALLPTDDNLVNSLVSDIELSELPEEQVGRVRTALTKKSGYLEQSQLWQAQDFDECVKSDDLFKSVQAVFADAYDTTNVSQKKKRKMEMRMEHSRVKFLHTIQSGAESMSRGFLPQAENKVVQTQKDKDKDKDKDKGKAQKVSKAAQVIQDKNRVIMEQKEKEQQERAWSNFFGNLEVKKDMSIDKLGYCAGEILKLLGNRKTLKDHNMIIRAQIERMKLLERQWTAIAKDTDLSAKRIEIAVTLFRGVHDLVRQYLAKAETHKAKKTKPDGKEHKKEKKGKKDDKAVEEEEVYTPLLDDEQLQILRRILILLGLKDNCKIVDKKIAKAEGITYDKEGKHKLPSSACKAARVVWKESSDENMRSHVRFQMSKMGHLFDRSTGEPDSRVAFSPDPWQREMLDSVDRRESILCCAPTSAGKTFISYYCMKEVVYGSVNDVVVYVAPTRALCNQAAQDVYSIFQNRKYNEGGWSLFGILGGGTYVQPLPPMGGPFQTQVLITIPSVFEHVMLSPRYQQWAKRVKYVIFDEVHCVDTSAEGHLWERLLMCTRAPFLALSATVGNFDAFQAWLNSTQALIEKQDKAVKASEERNYKIKGVFWNQRWNDLRKFIYLPRTVEERSKGKVKVAEQGAQTFGDRNIVPLHPFSTVTRAMLEKLRQFPQDLPLVPSESLELYDAMQEAFEEVSRMLIGSWSDDDGNRFKFEETQLLGRKGLLKGVVAKKTADVPEPPTAGFETEAYYAFENGGIWCMVNEDDELEMLIKKGGEVTELKADHEIDEIIIESVQEDGTLCPENFFSKDIAITQVRSREYEKALKDGFMSWVYKGETDPIARLMVDKIMEKLGGGLHPVCEKAEDIASEQKNPLDTKEFIETNFTDLLLCLNSEGLLPAIVFNFDQSICEDLAKTIVTQLEEAEEAYKQTNEWKNIVKRLTDKMEHQKKEVKAFKAAKDNKSTKKGEDGEDGGGRDEVDEPELVDCSIPDILPNYAFVHGERGDALKADDMERLLKDLEYDLDRSHFLIRALERGIGVHHAGLPTKYRNNVEKLFRMKKLKVVVATDGLALGIHSPCRTVVLAGDDVRLSTMQFRQMSGRAGRRGQDWIGHVLFYGIPEAKIVRLMTSGLPTLQGHMSIDTTTVLRMSLLHSFQTTNKGRDKVEVDQERVRHMSQCMMESMFSLGKTKALGDLDDEGVAMDLYKKFLRLQWRYTTDYLQREGLITPSGGGQFLPGLTTRALYSVGEVHMSPQNLVFSALMRRPLFQKNSVCAKFTREKSDANEHIVSSVSKFLATLFTVNSMGWKQEIHRSVHSNPDVGENENCPHDVVLEPLSDLFDGAIWNALKDYTRETLVVFSELAKKMGEETEKVHGKDTKLPLSRVSFAKKEEELEGLLKSIADQAAVVKARSPFVALCGLTDEFTCVDDLVRSLRSTLHIEEDSLPIVDYIDLQRKNPNDRWVPINAGCYDFVVEGPQLVDGVPTRLHLENLNGLNQSLSWAVLNRYFSAVTQITDLIERLAPGWLDPKKTFVCCNTLCAPENKKFTAENGLHKCHDCDLAGVDTWMCPKCYEDGEECVTSGSDGKALKNKTHVFFRHVYDKFVQTMSQITADLEPMNKELGRSQRTMVKRKKKAFAQDPKKPKRPSLLRPQKRGAQLFKTSHKKK